MRVGFLASPLSFFVIGGLVFEARGEGCPVTAGAAFVFSVSWYRYGSYLVMFSYTLCYVMLSRLVMLSEMSSFRILSAITPSSVGFCLRLGCSVYSLLLHLLRWAPVHVMALRLAISFFNW